MISSHKIRVAVAGLGRIAWKYHIPAILADARFELVAVADPLAERRQEAMTEFHLSESYASVSKLLFWKKIDLLVIASPTCFHAEQTIEAFNNGVDIICEKPLARNLAEAKKIVAAMKECQRKLMVYQPHRMTPEAVELRRILDSGALGHIFMVRRACCNFSRRNDWQAFAAYGGGMLNNYGSHFLDQFIYLFGGGFRRMNSETRLVVGGGDAEDFVKITAVNRNDIVFDLEINMGAAFASQEWLVCGTCGSARYCQESQLWQIKYCAPDSMSVLKVQTGLAAADRKYPHENNIPWIEQNIACSPSVSNHFYDYSYRYFALDETPLVPVEDSLEIMQMLEQCRKQSSPARIAVNNSEPALCAAN